MRWRVPGRRGRTQAAGSLRWACWRGSGFLWSGLPSSKGAGVAGAEFVPFVLALGEAALDVGMAEEGDGGGALLEWRPGVAHGEDVLVFVEGGAVGRRRWTRLS